VGADATRWTRQPGQGKYARAEHERRFLLRIDPPLGVATRSIEDRYIQGTRLRLRHVSADGQDVYKLTQKVRVRDEDPSDLLITNSYLSEEEHRVLSALPSRRIIKTRSVHRLDAHDFVVDVFHGRLQGLRLAEVEVERISPQGKLATPDWLGEEITHDDRYSGGALAFGPDEQIQILLATGATR
jgi:CYTH domain-containing protein